MATPNPSRADGWNARFASDEYVFGTAPNGWLRAQAGVWQAGQRVLCVADGEGRNSVWLAQQGLVVDAFDISPVGVAKAQRLAASAGVSVNYTVADCDGFAWPVASCDGVAAIFIQFADPALRARLFAHMQAAVKPGGTLVLQGYTPQQLVYKTGGPAQVENLYTEAWLREVFAGWQIETLRVYDEALNEGAGHAGLSALVGLVARKPA
jgi:SAM-dependent methyltransferase